MSDIDIHNMTDRELVAGLMRGDKDSMKLGYVARSAVLTVESLRYANNPEGWDLIERDLQAFAEGFAQGINEDHTRLMPMSV